MNPEKNTIPLMPAPEILDQLDAHIYQVAIFRAALELQVWAKVAAGENTVDRIAASQHWDLLGTRMLLDDLCALKLLAKEGKRYRLLPEAECYLLPDKPTYMGRYLLSDFGWEGNGQLAESIRTGKRPVGYNATTIELADTWISVYSRSWVAPETYLGRCDAMWQQLGIQGRDGLRVLDVACGPAPRSLALARAHLGTHVTLLDWEQILAIAIKVATDLGVMTQVTLLQGDLWTVPYGSNLYDVIYLGNITHFFSPEQNTRLFRKAHEALSPSGMLVVNAVRRECPDPMGPALWFYAISKGGAPYEFQEYRDMLESAGYSDIEDLNTQAIKATKRP
jgi:2-polyprenyl-3-methyl-5-hydroxy-6-metoxy-1,4-benzoquinol methylase